MKMTRLAATVAATMIAAGPTLADTLHFPNLSYRTGAFAAGGIPFADGYADYFTLINERDGGIGGVPIRYTECETAYDTERGVECYQSLRGENPLILQPLSTGITYQIIPRASEDGIPVHSMGYGRTSAANGSVFKWVFNYPGTYWDAASIMVQHARDVSDGSLEGKKITLLYHNSAYGREPIATLEVLSEQYGYDFSTIAVDSPGQEQGNQWLQIRRERPDFVFFWGWGVMNQVAVQEAANIRFPMDRFIGVWWSGAEPDVLPAGSGAHGYKSINFTGTGTDYPIFDDIHKYVVEPGKNAGDGRSLGTVQYNRGLYAAMLAVEAARTAQGIHGVANITSEMMRDGMEALNVTEERMAELGMANFAPPVSVSCEQHSGPGMALVQQWDAEAQVWNAVTDYITAEREFLDPLIEADSLSYAAEHGIELRCN